MNFSAFFATIFSFFLRNFGGFFSEFRDKFQKMMPFVDISIKFAKKVRKIAEISGIGENVSLFFIIFHSCP